MSERIYDWSAHSGPLEPVKKPARMVEVDDETLRDGLQGVQLEQHPGTSSKITYISWASRFVDHADIGFPGSETEHSREVEEIARHVISKGLEISLSCAARGAARTDIEPIIDVSHRLGGFPLEADIFLDTSNLRAERQGWDRSEMVKNLRDNIQLLKQQGLPIMFVPERSSATPPEEMLDVLKMAAELGVDRICLADTQGLADEAAIRNMYRWAFEEVGKEHPQIKWDGHFHNDRGLSLANCLVAVSEGVERVHATSFCIGERAGNVDLASLIVNLNLEGYRSDDLTRLTEFSTIAADLFRFSVPVNAPVIGRGAHSTASGVHASAIMHGRELGDPTSIYFGYDPAMVGARPHIEVGPFSGKANVIAKLEELGIEGTDEQVDKVLDHAKGNRGILSDTTIRAILNGNH